MDYHLISVIVPVYRVELYLDRCIQSVLRQTYTKFELLLIDDGSPDNCGTICDDYAKRDIRIRVIHQENMGLSEARNNGLKIAKGDYITFLDSDDFWHCDYLNVMMKAIQKYDADIVQCSYETGTGNNFSIIDKKGKEIIFNTQEALGDYRYKVSAWAKIYHRKVMNGVIFPKKLINEDDATYYRFAYNANRIVLIPDCLYYYFKSPQSIMRGQKDYLKEDFIKIYNERIDFFSSCEESLLLHQTHVRFSLVIMLFYFACKKNPQNKNNKDNLFNLFNQEYKKAKRTGGIPFKLFCMFFVFHKIPNISAWCVNKFKLK